MTKLKEECRRLGYENPHSRLVLENLQGENPDDVCYTSIAYEKGFAFIWYLQSVTGVENFELFLAAYIKKFSYTSLNTNEFVEFFKDFFKDEEKINEIDWDSWLNKPGLPFVEVKYDTSLQDNCSQVIFSSGKNDKIYCQFTASFNFLSLLVI